MEFKSIRCKQSIDEDNDIKGKSKKLVKGFGKKVATAEGAEWYWCRNGCSYDYYIFRIKRSISGSFVAVNASTVGVPIAAAAGYMAVRTAKSYMLEKKNKNSKKSYQRKTLLIMMNFLFGLRNYKNLKLKILKVLMLIVRTSVLDIAKKNIIVYSKWWATSYSINNEFKTKLKAALERGVNFYLGFGYESSKVETKASQEMIAKTVNELRELQN